jgi:hypothetical protein
MNIHSDFINVNIADLYGGKYIAERLRVLIEKKKKNRKIYIYSRPN